MKCLIFFGMVTFMKKLKMYWWNEQPNFGDALNPLIVERLFGIQVQWADLSSATLVGAGSCLQWVAEEVAERPREIHVWGTGYMFDKEPAVSSPLVQHHAVRGKYSRTYGGLEMVALGDPGILSSLLFEKSVMKRHAIGIVPHLWNRDDVEIHNLRDHHPEVQVIDVTQPSMEVIRQIAECEFIFSSSLHGLVVADSFGIPNQWVEFTRKPFGDQWKFKDYYSVFPIDTPKSLLFEERIVSDAGIGNLVNRFERREGIADMQKGLIGAFPKPTKDFPSG